MANDRALVIDGFPYEFYKEFWDMVNLDLIQVYKEDFASSSLGLMPNKGNVKFILKPRYPKAITN